MTTSPVLEPFRARLRDLEDEAVKAASARAADILTGLEARFPRHRFGWSQGMGVYSLKVKPPFRGSDTIMDHDLGYLRDEGRRFEALGFLHDMAQELFELASDLLEEFNNAEIEDRPLLDPDAEPAGPRM